MTNLERQVRTVQRRLWFNRWLLQVSRSVGIAAVTFAAIVLLQRLFDWPIPVLWIGWGLGGIALLASLIRTFATREHADFAAVKLDEAAGLRERISSGRYCLGSDDPFAQAVAVDAERASGAISARQHIPVRAPRPLALTALALVLALLVFLVPPGLLKPTQAKELAQQTEIMEQTKIAVKRKMEDVQQMAQANPALEDLKEELEGLSKQSGGMLKRPGEIRHEAIKKIDKLADAVGKKRKSDNYKTVQELRKMMRGLKPPQSDQAPTQKLAKALAAGDFKTAKEEMNKLREQLATLKSKEDMEAATKLTKQLDELAKQLEKVAANEKLVEQLQQVGMKKEDIERMLENLKKKDLDQLRKELEENGMSQEKIDKLESQLKQRQKAGALAKKLAQAMGKKGTPSSSGEQAGQASTAGLTAAAQQLSELEQLEQEMSQLESTLADLQSAKNDLDKPCSSCNGTGMMGNQPCSKCGGGQRPGTGMGKLGQGRGGLAPEHQTSVSFKTERAKVHTGKGAIIGQFLIDGEQVKGEVGSTFSEVISAAERDASDRINRDRVPRQYQKAVKQYFSNVQRVTGQEQGDGSGSSSGGRSNETSDQPPGAENEE
ncbi:MAG: hypothetical protein JSU63_13615 [Phycisphaerales bacterium]|nr:MAG: hypothetical protein JSU63_13615 [Phycisphaerales bacterium]